MGGSWIVRTNRGTSNDDLGGVSDVEDPVYQFRWGPWLLLPGSHFCCCAVADTWCWYQSWEYIKWMMGMRGDGYGYYCTGCRGRSSHDLWRDLMKVPSTTLQVDRSFFSDHTCNMMKIKTMIGRWWNSIQLSFNPTIWK